MKNKELDYSNIFREILKFGVIETFLYCKSDPTFFTEYCRSNNFWFNKMKKDNKFIKELDNYIYLTNEYGFEPDDNLLIIFESLIEDKYINPDIHYLTFSVNFIYYLLLKDIVISKIKSKKQLSQIIQDIFENDDIEIYLPEVEYKNKYNLYIK